MRIRSLVFVAALCTVLAAHAQESSQFGEVLEISLTNVDVIVTGRDGQPVTGLEPSDFEVFEDGKPQSITHFSEVRGDGASAMVLPEGGSAAEAVELPTPQAARRFVFYLDDSSLSLENRRVIFPAIRKFLADNLRPGDQALLATWNHSLKIRVPWTTDLAAVDQTLAALASETSSSPYLYAERKRVEQLLSKMEEEAYEEKNKLKPGWGEVEGAARDYATSYMSDLTQSTNALTRLLASLSGVDGRKVLVYATETLPTIAGAEIFAHLENIRTRAMLTPGVLQAGARSDSAISNLSRYSVQPMLDLLARAANATGVTVYGINPKGLGGPASGKADHQMPRDPNQEFARIDQALAGIKQLANRTGGVAMIGAPAEMALERVSRDLDAYYSIGYRSTPGKAQERRVEVRAKRPGLQVRTRANVFYRTLEREMADRVIANHLQSTLPNALGIALEADPVRNDGSRTLLPVRVVIPVNMLTLVPDGKGNMTGGFSVFTCSGDGQGATSGVNVQSQAIQFTEAQAAQMKGRRIGFAIQVPVEKGRPQVSVGVVDHLSQTQGFATMKATL